MSGNQFIALNEYFSQFLLGSWNFDTRKAKKGCGSGSGATDNQSVSVFLSSKKNLLSKNITQDRG